MNYKIDAHYITMYDFSQLLAYCKVLGGFMLGDVVEYVPNINDEDECAIEVRNRYPKAIGSTWYNEGVAKYWSCWAEFGGVLELDSIDLFRTCRFQGNLSR